MPQQQQEQASAPAPEPAQAPRQQQQQQQQPGQANGKPTYPQNAADAANAFPLQLPLSPLVPEGTPPSFKPSSPALCFQVGLGLSL